MTTDTAPVTAAFRKLAEAEEACPRGPLTRIAHDSANEEGVKPSCCKGTGRVPLFCDTEGKPLFRHECQDCNGSGRIWGNGVKGQLEDYGQCESGCHGLGWLPLDVSEVHLEMLIEVANRVVGTWAAYKVYQAFVDRLNAGGEEAMLLQEALEAAILALDAALEARG